MFNFDDGLEQEGKHIAAEIKKAREYEARAKEKAGVDLEKANNHWIAATQRLAEARKRCAESCQSFKEFKKKFAPDLSRATLYRVIAIGSGQLTIEEQRKEWREEKREKRAAAKVSRTSGLSETKGLPDNVKTINGQSINTDAFGEAAKKQIEAATTESEPIEPTAEASAEARKAKMAALDAPPIVPAPEAPTAPESTTTETMIQDAAAKSENERNEIEQILDTRLPKLMTVDKFKLFGYIIKHPAFADIKVPKREKAA
jgi:hypothetical protein